MTADDDTYTPPTVEDLEREDDDDIRPAVAPTLAEWATGWRTQKAAPTQP